MTLPVSEHAYKEDDLVEWLAKVVPTGEVEAFGAVRKNNLWHITMRSTEAIKKLLDSKVIVRGQLAHVCQCGVQEDRIQVHWAYHTICP